MKKVIPAAWFQNQLNPARRSRAKPRALELFEDELARVAGGVVVIDTLCGDCVLDDVVG